MSWTDKVLETIQWELHKAEMTQADNVGYGSLASVHQQQKYIESLRRIEKAVPKEVWEAYDHSIKREKANQLRREAAAIEKGLKK